MSEAEDNTQGEKQKKQKKKLGVFVRILKWLGLGVLIFLLIVGLFFQAPLKVNGLLLILILACTALPKKALKWFWISVAAVVIALVIWVFLPEKTQGWRPYTFDEELTALEANRVIPDEENAATIYNQLLEEYDSNSFDREFLVGEFYKPTMFSNWSNKDYPEIAKWAEGHKDTIRRLLDVCRFEKCLFPISFYPDNWEGRRERLLPMNDWAKLLIRTGNNDIAENRIDEGLRKYLCVLQMSKHEFQQPTTMDLFVGFNYEAYAIDRLNEFILTGDTTEERLALIKEGVAEIKHDWEHDWHLVIEDEKLWAKNFVSLFYEVNSKGWVRLTWRPEADLLQDLHMHLVPDRRDPGKFRKTWYIIGWFVMPLTPRGAYKIIDSNYKKYYEMFEADFDWIKSEPVFWLQSCKYEFLYVTLNKLMLQMKKTTPYRLHQLFVRGVGRQRGNRIIIGLRRYKNEHGNWPESLDEIKSSVGVDNFVDPFHGGRFVYKRTDDGFTLYSKGVNGIDEDGKRSILEDKDIYEPDDWLIWPPRDPKTEEEDEGVKSCEASGEGFPRELVDFEAYKGNPLFGGTGEDTWDRNIRERGFVLREGQLYHMWYTGYNDERSDMKYLGYATSRDGFEWKRYEGNPIFTERWVEDMFVVKHEGTYYMFAEGRGDIAHLLTSKDGIHWEDKGDLDVRYTTGERLSPGPYGTPTVLIEGNVWYLFYERDDLHVWLAKSRDLEVWTNVQDEPVLSPGPEDYDGKLIALDYIIRHEGRYYAYYHGIGRGPEGQEWGKWCASVAVSADLVCWKKYPNNPIVIANSPILVDDGAVYRLYCMHPEVRVYFPR